MSNTKRKKLPDDPIAIEMGRRLKREREAHEWSQEHLAKLVRASGLKIIQQTIGNFESGARRIRHESAFAFERIFDLPAGYFLAVLDDDEAAVIQAMRKRKPRHR